ncbi:MAG: lysophospholipid acyltransferase family protein, partial [Pseudomarimonas sp.]
SITPIPSRSHFRLIRYSPLVVVTALSQSLASLPQLNYRPTTVISVERSFYNAFPKLSEGKGRALSRPVVEWLRRIACESQINATLDALVDLNGLPFVAQALENMRFSYRVAPTDRENIPAEGRVVIVANHPLGALDALALLNLVGSVRSDLRILANDVLMQLQPLAELLIPCDVFNAQGARAGLREAYRALEREQALIVFPAGEVSRIRPDGVRDGRWTDGFVRFARRAGAPVLPVHIDAQNSATFYGLSMLAKPLATLLLPREMFAAQDQRITLTVGEQIASAALNAVGSDAATVAAAMRRHVYRIASRKPPLFATSSAIAHPESAAGVRLALRAAEVLGKTTDGKQILLLDPVPGCVAMREIGRLRELAFRRVGEGTGLKRDLDRFDAHYRHIVLWDEAALEIAGAYRVAHVRQVLGQHGMAGLYSASLFTFAPHAAEFLAHTVELGRSFVKPRYWGTRSLDYLWQGIGAFLRRHPEVRYVIGPVSLSAQIPEAARAWIVETHRHYFGDQSDLARARNPYTAPAIIGEDVSASISHLQPREGLSLMKAQLDLIGATLPILYRQYVDLCEPDGVRFIDFGVDPAFGHCVDGLIRIDLARLKPHKRSRYLGDDAAPLMSAA